MGFCALLTLHLALCRPLHCAQTLQATIVAGASPRHAVLNSKSSVGAAPPIQQQSADAYCAVM